MSWPDRLSIALMTAMSVAVLLALALATWRPGRPSAAPGSAAARPVRAVSLPATRREQFPTKWLPGSSKKMRPNKTLERLSDSEGSKTALAIAQTAAAARSAPAVVRRTTLADYERIASYLENAAAKVQSVHSASRMAARHIDNAEMALNRLLADVAPFMPERLTPTVVPRRSLA